MKQGRTYQVSDVARIARVSVRTLHHYDAIGLLSPSRRTEAGYRLYGQEDLLRLQQILIGRELGLSLEAIRRSLDDPAFDRRHALLHLRSELQQRASQTAAMIRAVEAAIAVVDGNSPGGDMEMKALFDGFDPSTHDEEVRDRWGGTDAYRESQKRTKGYTAEDWKRQLAEQAAIYAALAAAMQAGAKPSDDRAMDIVERHRLSIDRWFYPCSLATHRGLADMYEHDARFAATIDQHGEGLTRFFAAAIRANADSRRV